MADETTTDTTVQADTSDAGVQDQAQATQPIAQTAQATPEQVVQEPEQKAEIKGTWPDDWREQYVEQHGNDPKLLKRLQRYASPQAAIDALFSAQTKISTGQVGVPLKADASPEEKAEWRAANGLPETPADYKVTLPNGLVFSERDKPIVESFLKRAHDQNFTPAQVNDALTFYAEQQEHVEQDLMANDIGTQQACEDILREEYGGDYRRNLKAVDEMLSGVPGSIKDRFLSARTDDGVAIGNDPDVIRWLVGIARELNPIGTVVPGSGTNAVQAVEAEMNALRSEMGDHKSAYWKGPDSARKQARYAELVEAKQKGRF